MAYNIDPATGDLVISGFGNGIGSDPYSGLTDERNVNIISVPNEASVNFQTANITSGAVSGAITSVSGTTYTFSGGVGMENYIAIYFTGTGSYSGIQKGTPYWVGGLSGSTFTLYSDYNQASQVTITGTGTANFVAYQIGTTTSYITGGSPGGSQYFAQPTNVTNAAYKSFLVDGVGFVWSNFYVTGTNSYWTYTGNYVTNGNGSLGDTGVSNAAGNGLVYWRVSNGLTGTSVQTVDYLFVFRNSQIDFFVVSSPGNSPAKGIWTAGWNPANGATGTSNYLTTPPGTRNSHHAIVGPDGNVYFCDADNIGKWFQTAATTMFVPATTATYTYETFPILPINDVAQCLAPQGTNILVGGQGIYIYVWDTTSTLASLYIPVSEPFIARMITVNVNTYIFAGNRGRIYVTNGSQANLWAKIPDHLSGTVEPIFKWGGATAVKNQLYFSFTCTTNDGNPITTMGGLWAVDLTSQAMRLTNELSFLTYAGVATAMIAQVYNPTASAIPTGSSLFIGWYDGVSTYGVDIPSTSPYTGGQATVVSDIIPIGTLLHKQSPYQFEFKTTMPLLAGESISLYAGYSLADYLTGNMVLVGSTSGSATTSGQAAIISGNLPTTVQNQQWLIVQAILTGIASNSSFCRLIQMRVVGETLKTQIAAQPFATQ